MNLKRPYSFWIQVAKSDRSSYDENLVQLNTFSNVEDFWKTYQFLSRPSQLGEGNQILVFQKDIKPKWEDSANVNGGRFLFRIKNNSQVDRSWENLLLGYIGEQCSLNQLITGVIIHVKKSFNLISVWVRQSSSNELERIRDWIEEALNLSNKQDLEYYDHPKE